MSAEKFICRFIDGVNVEIVCDDELIATLWSDDGEKVCELLNKFYDENKQLKNENIELKKLRKCCAEFIGINEKHLYDYVR